VGCDPLAVASDGILYALEEVLFWDFWDGDVACGNVEAAGVGFGSEEDDVTIGTTVSLQSFVGLLAVVEGGSKSMDADVRVCDEFGLAPLAGCYIVF
jgi:hypothetical protein